jgi:hypothetical protein
VVRKGLGVLTRDGDWHVVVENPREDALATFLDRLEAATAVPDDLLACVGPRLQFPTGVCFAGQDLRTAYVGSLAMSRMPTFRAPVPGLPMRHWSWAIRAEPRGSPPRPASPVRAVGSMATIGSSSPPTGRPRFMRPPSGHEDLNDRA